MSLEWNSDGVMDGESGESMEEEEETDVGRGVSEVKELVQGCRRENGS